MTKNNPLAKQFTMKSLLTYTLPSVCMMIFMSTYTIIDGMFVANLVGEDALAAINIVFPLFGILFAVSLMFATGGNAIIARLLGEGKEREANEFLSVLYILGALLGILLSVLGFSFPEQTLELLGVNDVLYPYARDYLLSLCVFAAPVIFQVFAQSFFVTTGRPMLGFGVCVMGGVTNIVLDYIFISPHLLDLGISGAGLATGLGNVLPGLFGMGYFALNKKSNLHFVLPKLNLKRLLHSMSNGMSELVNSLSLSITTIMFNFILMDLAGETGVATISVILYIQQFQTAIYFGYTIGVAPIIAYKYGNNDKNSLYKIMRQSLVIVSMASVLIIVFTLLFLEDAVSIFIAHTSPTFDMAKTGLLLFMPSYLFMGYNIFASSMFTAFSNGKVSAVISIMRSLVFIVLMLMILPNILGITGVWLAIPIAELFSFFISLYFFMAGRTVYGYNKPLKHLQPLS